LGVELPREALDLFGVNRVRTAREALTYLQVIQVIDGSEFSHGATLISGMMVSPPRCHFLPVQAVE
jgi:hypothetical protein